MARHAYRRLCDTLRERILRGDLPPGERLPSERELCEEFGVSRITTRHALHLLEEQGLVERRAGRGTFVRARRPKKLAILSSDYAASVRRQSLQLRRELLWKGLLVPPVEVAELLGLGAEEECFLGERLDYVGDEPLACDRAYIPLSRSHSITEEMLVRIDFLNAWLEAERVEHAYTVEGIEAVEATGECVERLGVELGVPMLQARDTIYTTEGLPLAVFQTIYRGDRFKLVATVVRGPDYVPTRH